MSHMLVKDQYKLIIHEGYPSRLFNLAEDPGELNDLAIIEPDRVRLMTELLESVLDRKETLGIWEDYRRHTFAQFQRQTRRGLYLDQGYSLRKSPSSDYREIMNNAFTGWNNEDEARVAQWLAKETP